MASLTDLDRRLSRKLEARKGIQLTPDELDLLVTTGAYQAFRDAVATHQRDLCLQRSEASRSTSAVDRLARCATVRLRSLNRSAAAKRERDERSWCILRRSDEGQPSASSKAFK